MDAEALMLWAVGVVLFAALFAALVRLISLRGNAAEALIAQLGFRARKFRPSSQFQEQWQQERFTIRIDPYRPEDQLFQHHFNLITAPARLRLILPCRCRFRFLLKKDHAAAPFGLPEKAVAQIKALFSCELVDTLGCDGKRLRLDLCFDPTKLPQKDLRFIPQAMIELKRDLQTASI